MEAAGLVPLQTQRAATGPTSTPLLFSLSRAFSAASRLAKGPAITFTPFLSGAASVKLLKPALLTQPFTLFTLAVFLNNPNGTMNDSPLDGVAAEDAGAATDADDLDGSALAMTL